MSQSYRLSLDHLADYLAYNDLRVEGENVLAPYGEQVGKVIVTGSGVALMIFEAGYTQGDVQVKAWWPHVRPAYFIGGLGSSQVETGPPLGPDQVVCDVCNADVLVRPVPIVGTYALCLQCFSATGLPFPGSVTPRVPLSLVPRDGRLMLALGVYCDVLGPEDVLVLRSPARVPIEARRCAAWHGMLRPEGSSVWELTERGQELRSRIETVLSLDWAAEPPVPGVPDSFRVSRDALAEHRLGPDHVKALHLLAEHPGCTWRTLSLASADGVPQELSQRGLAAGECRLGAPWRLTEGGRATLLEIAEKVEHEQEKE